MQVFLALVILLVACSDDTLDNEGADSEKKEFSYTFEVNIGQGNDRNDRIMKGDKFWIAARLRFDNNEDQANYEAAHYKDDGKDFIKSLRNNDADPSYRKISLTLDSSVKGAKISGLTTGKTDNDGRIAFNGLKINKAGRHKIVAKTTINGQDLSATTHDIEINTPLDVQLSKIRGLRVGEAFDVTINREYPLIDEATIDMVNFDGLMMWDNGQLSQIDDGKQQVVFKELFFYKPLPAGTREMLVEVDRVHEQLVVSLPELGDQIGNVDIVSYDGNELIVNNLRARSDCQNNCQVDAFTVRGDDIGNYGASVVTDTNGRAELNVKCNTDRAHGPNISIVVKVSQNNESFYFLFPKQDCN